MQLHTCIYIKSKQSIPDRLSSKIILKNECEQWDSSSQPHEPDKNKFVLEVLIYLIVQDIEQTSEVD